MSAVTVGKNGRVYQRLFDHEEAMRRYQAGETPAALAREYGVSDVAVRRVVVPGVRERMYAANRRYWQATCAVCGGKVVSNPSRERTDGRVLCRQCSNAERRERLRFNEHGILVAVRCSMLDCANGERWQPPANFPHGPRHHDVRPGGIHGQCRACNTRSRREYRKRHREAQNAYDREYKARRRAQGTA